ncbi:MAG: penicillin-insensitive murein endopeptidase, partial [Deltaproteobacteria bacterium]|nr:penicillin-insensitive murein endopeptidase [Deltaproteobacteria bacterium]
MLTRWSFRLTALLALLCALACSGPVVAPEAPGGHDAGPAGADAGAHVDAGSNADAGADADGGTAADAGDADAGADAGSAADAGSSDAGSTDAGTTDAGSTDAGTISGTAPAGAIAGEVLAAADNAVAVSGGKSTAFRFEAAPDEHVALRLDFTSSERGVKLTVLRWDGEAAVQIGYTDGGAGLRVLAVHDESGPRTFWARVDATVDSITGAALHLARTPFADAPKCTSDCARLMQLPLPIAPATDGYDTSAAIMRYQFGRRDLLMFLREAGRRMVSEGRQPFAVEDLSQWDGQTPGTDVGSPRHASHQRGKDVDVALYGTDEKALFRSYCTTHTVTGGRECIAGTRSALFEALYDARLIGAFYA